MFVLGNKRSERMPFILRLNAAICKSVLHNHLLHRNSGLSHWTVDSMGLENNNSCFTVCIEQSVKPMECNYTKWKSLNRGRTFWKMVGSRVWQEHWQQNEWSSPPLPALWSSRRALASSSGSSDSLQACKETHPEKLLWQMCYFFLLWRGVFLGEAEGHDVSVGTHITHIFRKKQCGDFRTHFWWRNGKWTNTEDPTGDLTTLQTRLMAILVSHLDIHVRCCAI